MHKRTTVTCASSAAPAAGLKIIIIKRISDMEVQEPAQRILSLPSVPHDLFIVVVGFLTSSLNPLPLLPLFQVCKSWRNYLDEQDSYLWQILSIFFSIPLHIPSKTTVSRFSLRSTVNYKRQFFQVFHRKKASYEEKHEALMLQAKSLLEQKRDCVGALKKLILKIFPKKRMLLDSSDHCKQKTEKKQKVKCIGNASVSHKTVTTNTASCDSLFVAVTSGTPVRKRGKLSQSTLHSHESEHADFLDMVDPYFNVNWRSMVLESNSLLTLSARYCHLKSMRFVVEELGGAIDIADVGGFSALIICAFRGFMPGVQYCVKKGANIGAIGRLRSGDKLTAEHWAAVQGQMEIMQYLRAHRMRQEKKLLYFGCGGSNHSFASQVPILTTAVTTSSSSFSSGATSQDALTATITPTVSGSFCICGKGFVGSMVACDQTQCAVEWYHFECVGLLESPLGEWTCPTCRGEAFSQPIKIKNDPFPQKKKRKCIRISSSIEDLSQNHEDSMMSERSLLDDSSGSMGVLMDYSSEEITNDSRET